MKQRRLIKSNYTPKGVSCSNCKFAISIDVRHNKYYCTKPEEKYWVYYGEHVCGKGEPK